MTESDKISLGKIWFGHKINASSNEKLLWHSSCFPISMKQHSMTTLANTIKLILTVVVVAVCGHSSVNAQVGATKTRVAVVANDAKTSIWVSNFPKNVSIVIFDGEDNLISITSTNDFGAAYISLPKGVKSGVIVKTINGEVSASNKSVIKNRQEEQNIVTNYQDDSNKA